MKESGKGQRIELGQFVVADPGVCHGKLIYRGTRIMVWQELAMLERGESWDYIREAWPGQLTDEAIAETLRLARASLLDNCGRLAKARARHRSSVLAPGRTPSSDRRMDGVTHGLCRTCGAATRLSLAYLK